MMTTSMVDDTQSQSRGDKNVSTLSTGECVYDTVKMSSSNTADTRSETVNCMFKNVFRWFGISINHIYVHLEPYKMMCTRCTESNLGLNAFTH